jgi:hypothetical protein
MLSISRSVAFWTNVDDENAYMHTRIFMVMTDLDTFNSLRHPSSPRPPQPMTLLHLFQTETESR